MGGRNGVGYNRRMDKRLLIAVILIGALAGLGFYLYQNIYSPMKPTFRRSTRVVD